MLITPDKDKKGQKMTNQTTPAQNENEDNNQYLEDIDYSWVNNSPIGAFSVIMESADDPIDKLPNKQR